MRNFIKYTIDEFLDTNINEFVQNLYKYIENRGLKVGEAQVKV